MTRNKAIILAAFTAWPLIYMVLFFGFMLLMTSELVLDAELGGGTGGEPPMLMLLIFPLHLLTILEMLALEVVYIVYLFRTDRVDQDKKALWAVVLFLGNMIAMPIFWYLHIWKHVRRTGGEPA